MCKTRRTIATDANNAIEANNLHGIDCWPVMSMQIKISKSGNINSWISGPHQRRTSNEGIQIICVDAIGTKKRKRNKITSDKKDVYIIQNMCHYLS